MDLSTGWHRTELSGAAPARLLSDVIAFRGTFLASGLIGEPRQGPIVLESTDGLDWTPESISSDLSGYPSSLTPIGDRVIGVGAVETGRCAHPFAIDTWVSDTGGSWTEAPWSDHFCAGLEWASVVSSGDRIQLIGTGSGDQPLSWISQDGLTWTDERPDLAEFLGRSAMADADGALVLGTDPTGTAGMRRTVDGRHFASVPFPPVDRAAFPVALLGLNGAATAFVVTGRGDLVVVRRDPTGSWISVPAIGLRGELVTRIEAASGGVIAFGADDTSTPLAWRSADGVTWQPIVLPDAHPGIAVSAVAMGGGTAVLVGATDSPDGLRTFGTIWTGPASLLGLPG